MRERYGPLPLQRALCGARLASGGLHARQVSSTQVLVKARWEVLVNS